MTENSESPPTPRSTRRNVLRRIGMGVGAVAAGVAMVNNERNVEANGILTKNARFYPLYEAHTIGPDRTLIRDDFDAVVREGIPLPEDIIKPMWDMWRDAKLSPRINPEKIARNGTKYFYPDVMHRAPSGPRDPNNPVFDPQGSDEVLIDMWLKEAVAGIAAATTSIGIQKYIKNNQDSLPPQTMSRLQLLRRAFIGAGIWSVSDPISSIGNVFAEKVMKSKSIARIMQRVQGLQSHAHPEDVTTLFRNLVMVSKSLTYADQVRAEKGRVASIGLRVGKLHAGMEDLLQAGPDFCRFLLTSFPADYLKYAVEINGGLENFCSSREVTLSKDFKLSDLQDPTKRDKMQEKRILDKPLFTALQAKLAA